VQRLFISLVMVFSLALLASCTTTNRAHRVYEGDAGLLNQGLLSPIETDGYGLGVHRDAAGQPFRWVPQHAPQGFNDPLLRVTPNAYGLGVGADQYGRPVQAVPFP